MNTPNRTSSELNMYPDLIWMSDWTFGYDPLSEQSRARHNGTVFKTLPDKGFVTEWGSTSWKIRFQLPHKSHIHYFSNGLIVKRHDALALIVSPAPNVLCGFICKRYGIELDCDHTHSHENGTAHFHSESGASSLLRNESNGNIYFSLAVNMSSHEEADKLAADHLTHTPEELIPLHRQRQRIIHNFDQFKKLNTLPAIAGECLLKQLRIPEGVLTEIWPASPAFDNKAFSLNELYPLLTVWCDIDLAYACKMYDMVLGLQRQDGHFPAWISPTGDRNSFDAPHLFFAQCADLLLQKSNDQAYAKQWLPRLNNYIRWCLRHYFPQNALHPAGQSVQETISPDLWKKGFSSAEHTTLLLCELTAIIHLHDQTNSTIPIFITQAYDKLTALFEKEFWNQKTRTFSSCYLLEEHTTRYGLHEYLPLLYRNLEGEKRTALLAQFKLSPWSHGFQADPLSGKQASPITPFQQFILLQCIKHPANPANQTAAHVSRTWNNLTLWQNRHFHRKLHTDMPIIDTAFICLLIDLQTLRMSYVRQSAAWLKGIRTLVLKLQINRDDLLILLVFAFTLFGTHTLYQNKTASKNQTTIQEARASYEKSDLKETIRRCQILLNKDPEHLEARLLLANLLLANGSPEEAVGHYRQLRKLDEDNPAFLIGLAMALHRQGQTEAANKYYQEFQDYFAPYFPETSKWVTRMQNIDTPKLTNYFIQRMISSEFMQTL